MNALYKVVFQVGAICFIAAAYLMLRSQWDFSDLGVGVIFAISMLLVIAAIKRWMTTNTDADGRLRLEKDLRELIRKK